MQTILFVHQSAELYGSDKALLSLVKELPKHNIRPIVVLPEEGILVLLLCEAKIDLIISPVIKLSRTMFSFKNLVKLPFQFFSSLYKLNKKLTKESIDLVHSNTLAVFLGAFYAKWKKIDHIWHVHEIIEKPQIINRSYRFIVNALSTNVVFNSRAAYISLVKKNIKLKAKSSIIYNGVEKPNNLYSIDEINDFKKNELKTPPANIIIGMVGRISRWKGQSFLLDAFDKLQKANEKVSLLIIGSPPPEQVFYLTRLKEEIAFRNLENKVHIIPFAPNIWKYWSCIDIAVVPSIEPEPFGLVAVEAMYAEKPVIASKHGGLLEIIKHNHSGLLFEPNNTNELHSALKLLVDKPDLRKSLAKNGHKIASEQFTVENYVLQFVNLYKR
ncbi:MAG: glycosyltransferase family 4 protein [Bacteroidales bacterium]|jgi:glycosyltransferase involved in cell wall biosynthesis|nr:glycosyltransferase family 4 protein [Bacteroidales bacterium]